MQPPERTGYEIFGKTQKFGFGDSVALEHPAHSCVRRVEQFAYMPHVSLTHWRVQERLAGASAQLIAQEHEGEGERKGEEQFEEL